MPAKFKLPLIRLIIIQLIPVFGLLFFDWKLFDLAVLYILESMAIFFVFNLHQYFINKKTRYPFIFALIQLLFSLIFFSGFVYGYFVIIYVVTGETEHGHFQNELYSRLMEMNFWTVLVVLIVFELISFYLKQARSETSAELNFLKVMKRLLYTHLFVIGGLILLVLTAGNVYLLYPLFILMKIAFELAQEDPKLLGIRWFSKEKK